MPRRRAFKSAWDDRHYVQAYRLAVSGSSDNQIAQRLGVKSETFAVWVRNKPALAEALEQARVRGAGTREFMRFVAARMPADLQELWERLSSDDPEVRAQASQHARDAGMKHTQHLWIHAYIAMNFNHEKAAEAIGIANITVQTWKRSDKKFQRLLELVSECRGDFYENALIEKVAEGDAAAIIFANKTYNQKRGYGAKMTLEVAGEVEHKQVITVKELSLEAKMALLEEIRKKKGLAQLEDRSQVQDAEFEEKVHESDQDAG